jgi:heptosyltransferase III
VGALHTDGDVTRETPVDIRQPAIAQQPAIPDAVDLRKVHSVLVIKLRHHGDVLLATPVLSALKRLAPHAAVDALVYRETAEMIETHPAVRRVHSIDRDLKRAGIVRRLRGELGLWRDLRAGRYDLVVHLTEHRRGAWLTRLINPRYAVGPERNERMGWWRRSFTHCYLVPKHSLRHTIETNLDALRRIGMSPGDEDKAPIIVPPAATQTRVARLMQTYKLTPKNFIVVHPGSRWLFKSLPATSTAALIDQLSQDNWRVVVTGSRDPAERALIDAILASIKTQVVDLVAQLSLLELAALIASARLLIGVDSAPMHIATAVGTPVLATFGPSGEAEWGPTAVPSRVVASTEHPCRPCGNNGCGGSNVSDCLVKLPVSRVIGAARELLLATVDDSTTK